MGSRRESNGSAKASINSCCDIVPKEELLVPYSKLRTQKNSTKRPVSPTILTSNHELIAGSKELSRSTYLIPSPQPKTIKEE